MKKNGWINLYRSGYFHREGKPNALDRHGGDVYDSAHEAVQQIEPMSHYIDTVPIEWEDSEDINVNPSSSVPVPLSVSRRRAAPIDSALVDD